VKWRDLIKRRFPGSSIRFSSKAIRSARDDRYFDRALFVCLFVCLFALQLFECQACGCNKRVQHLYVGEYLVE
jgi:hypothetical protein